MQNSQELNIGNTSVNIETYLQFSAEIARAKSDFESSKKAMEALGTKLAEAIERKRVYALAFLTAEFEELGVSSSELSDSKKANPKKVSALAPKYRNSVTGETWSGRGHIPKWIEGQDRNQYLIVDQAPSAIADAATDQAANPASEQVASDVVNILHRPTVDAIDRCEVSPIVVPASLNSPNFEPTDLEISADPESALIDQMLRDEAMA